jgi:hypothetical protein
MSYPLGLRAALVAAMAVFAGCSTTTPTATGALPESLRVPAGEVLALRARGIGVQIYECRMSAVDPSHFEWVLKAPEAELFDHDGRPIIRHYAGPTWQAADGSAVVGVVVARDNAPDPAAIPWLLLRVDSSSGRGPITHTHSIQRLHTVGGTAPASGCSAAQAGSEARVHYSADYLFYSARS